MIQCSRAPIPSSGSKWKTSRCSQYSVSVQKTQPPAIQAVTSSGGWPSWPSANRTAIAGMKMTSGMTGWTRDS